MIERIILIGFMLVFAYIGIKVLRLLKETIDDA